MPLHKNQTIPLKIDSVSNDGNGVGRHEGQAIFVPATAVGDVLQVQIVKPAKTHAFGRIKQVVTAGPGRIQPECPISHQCGGCAFWHISYEAELAVKQGFVEDALRRIGKLDTQVLPILPSPTVKRYRNKMQLPVQAAADGSYLTGFYAGRSHRVVKCNDCLLQPKPLNQIAARAAKLLEEAGAKPYDETLHTGLIRHIYLRSGTHSGEVLVCIIATHASIPKRAEVAHTLAGEFPAIKAVVVNVNPARTNVITGPENHILLGDGTIRDTLCGVPVRLGVHSFHQVNTLAAESLFSIAQEYAALQPGETLLDLYCGAGVIGLSMAKKAGQLIGVEIVPEAAENARLSAAEMKLGNTRFLCEDAGSAATRLEAEGLQPDVITVDPPRKGCDTTTLTAMVKMAPKRIVMVSCNPATMARDAASLVQQGYTLQKVQPADMFPRTKHVECVALFTKAAE